MYHSDKSSHNSNDLSTSPCSIPDQIITRSSPPKAESHLIRPVPPSEALIQPESRLPIGYDFKNTPHLLSQQRQSDGNGNSNDACAESRAKLLDHHSTKPSSFDAYISEARNHLYLDGSVTTAKHSPICTQIIEGDHLRRRSANSLAHFIPVTSGTMHAYQDTTQCRRTAKSNLVEFSTTPRRGVRRIVCPNPSTVRHNEDERSKLDDNRSSSSYGSVLPTAHRHSVSLRGLLRETMQLHSSHLHLSQTGYPNASRFSPEAAAAGPSRQSHFDIGSPIRHSTPIEGDKRRAVSPVSIAHILETHGPSADSVHSLFTNQLYHSSFTDRQYEEIGKLRLLVSGGLEAIDSMTAFLASCGPAANIPPISRACTGVRDKVVSLRHRLQGVLEYKHWALASPSAQERHLDRLLSINRNLKNLQEMVNKITGQTPRMNRMQKIIDKLGEYDRNFADAAQKLKLAVYGLEVKRLQTSYEAAYYLTLVTWKTEQARRQELKRQLQHQKVLLREAKDELLRAREMLAACRENGVTLA